MIEADLGGIVPDRAMQAGFCRVPSDMELSEGAIHWNLDGLQFVRPGVGLLAGFVELWDWGEPEIFDYAKKWGVLGICQHQLPASHNNYPFGAQYGANACCSLPSHRRGYVSADPIEDWRRLSKRVRAAQNLGGFLNQDKFGRPSDWKLLGPSYAPESQIRTLAEERVSLSRVLKDFLSIGQVRPSVNWDDEKGQWQIEFRAHSFPNLFGLIALNLLLSISGRDLVICSSCGNSYRPERRPDPSRRNYCPTCGPHAAQRDASRDYRERKSRIQSSRRKRR